MAFQNRRSIASTLLLIFALQVIVPVGFMPADLSTGWFVKLCPQGLSPETMRLFHPEHDFQYQQAFYSKHTSHSKHNSVVEHSNHHTGHHSNQHSNQQIATNDVTDDNSSKYSTWQRDCQYGASINNVYTVSSTQLATTGLILHSQLTAVEVRQKYSRILSYQNRARAPPEQLMI